MKKMSLRKLMMISIVVIILPINICFAFLYIFAYTSMEKMVTQIVTNNNITIVENIDNQLEQIILRQQEFLLNRNVDRLVFNDVESYNIHQVNESKLEVQQFIGFLKSSNNIIDRVEIYFPYKNILISTEHGINTISSDQIEQVTKGLETNSRIVHGKDGLYVYSTTTNSQFLSDKHLPLAIIVSTIDYNQIIDNISTEVNVSDSMTHSYAITSADGSPVDMHIAESDMDIFEEQYSYEQSGTASDTKAFYSTSKDQNIITYVSSNKFDLRVYSTVPTAFIAQDLNTLRILSIASFIFSGIVLLLFFMNMNRLFYRPAKELVTAFETIKRNKLGIKITKKSITREYEEIFNSFNDMSVYLKELVEKNYENGILIKEAQFKQLQYQINPHFLYNSFFIISSMANQEDNENVAKMCKLLGQYLKYIVNDNELHTSLKDEVEYARVYSQIQEFRFLRRLKVEFEELPEELSNFQVPRLLLQPLVENAFIHGTKDIISDGIIRVSFRYNDDCIMLVVENNGEPNDVDIGCITTLANIVQEEASEGGLALRNIQRRLKLFYNNSSSLHFDVSELGGLKVSIVIVRDGQISRSDNV